MAFIKVVKTKAYFKRYQVKFRRRREGKTDYRQRKRLIMQDKNKYNSPKYRLIVRKTNNAIICQIGFSKISGDVCLCSAYSRELPRYGIKVGLTNYSAAYATGLLVGRRLLKKLNLDTKYAGVPEINGEDYFVEPVRKGPRPFLALLDVGLARTTRGARVFAAMKGAADAGLCIPHSETRFAGYNLDKKELDAAILRKYIFGGHVADYMKQLSKDNPEKYQSQFSRFIKAGVKPEDLEGIYKKAHAQIKADPAPAPKSDKKVFKVKRAQKRTLAQRRDRVRQLLSSGKYTIAGQ